jgi:tetratricopeptide (TPR) repeat protein
METMNPVQLFKDTRQLTRLVWITLATIVGLTLAFAGYYYWDRYVHLGDQSPLERGASELEARVRQDPNDPEPRLALAEYYLSNQNYSGAIDQAQQVLANYPDSDRASFTVGLAYALSGQSEMAIKPLERFADLHRKSAMAASDMALEAALYYLGDNYLKLDRPGDAISVLSEALTISPTDADALYLLGQADFANRDPKSALMNYQKAANLVPDYAEVYVGMAACYTSLNMPEYVDYAQGMQAFATKDYQSAKVRLLAAVEKLPDFAPASLGLGLAYEQLGDLQKAEILLEHAVSLDSTNFVATNALGRIRSSLNK